MKPSAALAPVGAFDAIIVNPRETRLLVVAPDPQEASTVAALLKVLSYNVAEADSFEAALSRASEFAPHLILLEPDLRGRSGIELLETVKKTSPDTGVIFMAQNARPETILHAFFEGASGFLSKPLFVTEVDLRIRSVLKKIAYRKQMQNAAAQLEAEKQLLLRYFSAEVAEKLLSGEMTADLKGARANVSMFFLSLRNSSSIAHSMSAADFASFLSQIFVDVLDLVYSHNGSVNKLTGAGILATFGLPVASPDDARNCVECARSLKEHFQLMNETGAWARQVDFGIGIATGPVFAGNIGSYRKMEYTVIGDPANLAARLDQLSRNLGLPILSDGETVRQSAVADAVRIEESHVRGKKQDVEIYRL